METKPNERFDGSHRHEDVLDDRDEAPWGTSTNARSPRAVGAVPGVGRRDLLGVRDAPGHAGDARTPERFLQALLDATVGYEAT